MTLDEAYQTLELSRNASLSEAQEAWRDLVSIWHPDKHQGNSRRQRRAEREQAKATEYARIMQEMGATATTEPSPYPDPDPAPAVPLPHPTPEELANIAFAQQQQANHQAIQQQAEAARMATVEEESRREQKQ